MRFKLSSLETIVKPIYDSNGRCVGWFSGEHVFDLGLNWQAYFKNGHFFAARSQAWLGPLHNGSLLDQTGQPVAWLLGSIPTSSAKPAAPLRPMKPLHPVRPLFPPQPQMAVSVATPIGGWSRFTWLQWVGDEPLQETPSENAAEEPDPQDRDGPK